MIPMALSLPGTAVAQPAAATAMDEAAFRVLYERTARPLRAYLARCCGDPSLADDLLQEAYLRYLRSNFAGESEDHRRHYLFRIATNLLRDSFRRRRPETGLRPEHDGSPAAEGGVDLRSDVGGALAELSPKDRQMLWLAYAEGASHVEIAGVLGLRAASIRSMLFRARRRLAAKLEARGFRPFEEAS
jgi:RNA polymerase sigma-70 factor (ECF subfamily)